MTEAEAKKLEIGDFLNKKLTTTHLIVVTTAKDNNPPICKNYSGARVQLGATHAEKYKKVSRSKVPKTTADKLESFL